MTMFTPAPMSEVNLFIQDRDIQSVTLAIIRMGLFQVEMETQTTASSADWTGSTNAYTSQASHLADLLKALDIVPQMLDLREEPDVRNDLARGVAAYNAGEREISCWQKKLTHALQEQERLDLLIEQLRLLVPVQIPIEKLAGFRILHLVAGTLPGQNLARIQTALFRIPFLILPVHESGARVLIFAATTHEHMPILERALHSALFEPIPLPQNLTGLPVEVLDDLQQQRTQCIQRIQALTEERRQLANTWQETLLAAWTRARIDALLADTLRRFPRQGHIYVVAGWTPADNIQRLASGVTEASAGRAVIEVLEPDVTHAGAPTLLRNPPFFRAFEQLVTAFGYPAYNELDPTPVLAISFLLMYGMMFGDMGHGLLLAGVGAWLYCRRRKQRTIAGLLAAAGVSGFLFGFLYGTAFGIEVLPAPWLRPLDSILAILLAAVIGGIIFLNVGFFLHLINTWRIRDWSHLLLDRNGLVGVWLYWTLLGGAIALWQGLVSAGVLLGLAAVPTILLFFQEPLRRGLARDRPLTPEGWSETLLLAFFEMFETIVSYVSNSLSFVRLGAFAVAHEGLSQVILLLAAMAGPWGQVPILVAGTILLVGFEGLIVGIQTLRLEYYEFFSKFFQGNGRRFSPVQLPDLEGQTRTN
jgi:V/A-type H+-transporting ATPase subunit I